MDTLYKGNSVFRNQPSYAYFNKPADDPKDLLNLYLNEIDPHFLTESLEVKDKTDNMWKVIMDPRTKKGPRSSFIDHSYKKKRKLFFENKKRSALNKATHIVCLRVLHSWQEQEEVYDSDLIIYRRMAKRIEREHEEMRLYVSEFAKRYKENIYEPTKCLDTLYQNWYKRSIDHLLKKYPENIAFNTHTGLPHASICKNFSDEKVELVDVKLITKKGWVQLSKSQYDWHNLNFRLNSYVEACSDDYGNEKTMFEEKLKNELEKFNDEVDGRNFFIPFDTILFLLTSGEYVDLPTEVLLEIRKGTTDKETTIIVFDKPFPARNCGWHTHQRIVQQAFTEFVAVKGRCEWVYFDEDELKEEPKENCDIYAVTEKPIRFSPLTLEECIARNSNEYEKLKKKTNEALVEWHLKNQKTNSDFKILTTLHLPPLKDKKSLKFLPHESLKLEYKPQFGCEIMTKYELLKAWLQVQLMNFTNCGHNGICYRLAADNFELELSERLSLESIELNLKKNYMVDAVQLFSNLAEFLKLLSIMTTGKYLLRYSPKYKEKFLLCKPTEEITQNTIFLHNLIKEEPTNLAFMTQHCFLPINDSLCSAVHLENQILPGTFFPWNRNDRTDLENDSRKTKKSKSKENQSFEQDSDSKRRKTQKNGN